MTLCNGGKVRVKISYGVDIEDVPSEIEQLFDFVYEKKLKFDFQGIKHVSKSSNEKGDRRDRKHR